MLRGLVATVVLSTAKLLARFARRLGVRLPQPAIFALSAYPPVSFTIVLGPGYGCDGQPSLRELAPQLQPRAPTA